MPDMPKTKSKSNWEKKIIILLTHSWKQLMTIQRKFLHTNKFYIEKTIINEFLKRDDLVFTKEDKVGATTTNTRC